MRVRACVCVCVCLSACVCVCNRDMGLCGTCVHIPVHCRLLQAIPENEILRPVYDVFIDRCDLSILLGEEEKVSKARARMPGEQGGWRERRRERRVRVRLVGTHTRETLRTHTTQTRTCTCAQTNTDTDRNIDTQTHRRTDTQTRKHADTQTQRGMDAKKHRRIDAQTHTPHANTYTFMNIKKCPSAYTHKCS